MVMESADIPIPSEVIMPFGGFIASAGKLTLLGIVITGALVNLFGSIVDYLWGSRADGLFWNSMADAYSRTRRRSMLLMTGSSAMGTRPSF